jgi:hypothetical protein
LFFVVLWSTPAFGQAVLNADGPGNTYELINSVFAPSGGDVVENPECVHPEFGRHIAEVWDADLGQYVFEFYIHVTPDNDRCINFDRQRMEIKTYDQSPDSLIGVVGETVTYKWKFRLPAGFQPSTNFTHIHQIKAVGGDDADPIFTLTVRKATPDRIELKHDNATVVATAPLSSFLATWVECTEVVKVDSPGTYSMTIKKVSDGSALLTYANNSIKTIRGSNTFIRPKWGIYRSLLAPSDLRDEAVRFAGFSIQEASAPLPVSVSYFDAATSGNNVEVRWTTQTEAGCHGFDIERRTISDIGIRLSDYVSLAFLEGAGTSTAPRVYRFLDRNVPSGRYGYRIKQIDTNGAFVYHAEMEVEVSGAPRAFDLRAYPNPFNPSTTIEFTVEAEDEVTLEAFDPTGRMVATLFRGKAITGYRYRIPFEADGLSSGTYLVRLTAGDQARTKKVVLMR